MKKRKPGEAAPDAESDVDAAIAAGKAGGTHRIAKQHPNPGPSKVKGDPERPPEAAVNARREMSYDQAMKGLAAREELEVLKRLASPTDEQRLRMAALSKIALTRNVLTERGWVCVNREPPSMARA